MRARSRGGRPLVLAAVLLASAIGCGWLEPPPVELAFRDSLVGAGEIVQVKNTSSEPLTGIEVTIEAPSGESRTFVQEKLDGYQMFEVGWKKLDGWQVPRGSEVVIGVDGYVRAVKGRIEAGDGDR